MTMSRRQLFIAAGLMGAGMFWHPGVAHADEVSWRDELLAYYLPDRAGSGFSVKELVSGSGSQLEVWELPGAGYLLVDAASQAMIEYSLTAVSPLHGFAEQKASYLGLGEYVVDVGGKAVNALSGAERDRFDRGRIGEATDEIASMASVEDSRLTPHLTVSTRAVPPPVGTNVDFRIPVHGYITGCTVLHNTNGDNRCGWIAATIVMRYWHARSGKTLIPAAHRSGTNIRAVSGSDFADLIRDGRSAKTWGFPVSQGMGYHAAERMGVKSSCWYNAFSMNLDSALKAGRPAILFGYLPDAYSVYEAGSHAVVAYGKSKDGHSIVHYGYPDKPEIILNGGIPGTITHFMLS